MPQERAYKWFTQEPLPTVVRRDELRTRAGMALRLFDRGDIPTGPSSESEAAALRKLVSDAAGNLTAQEAGGLRWLEKRVHESQRDVFWRSVLLDLALRHTELQNPAFHRAAYQAFQVQTPQTKEQKAIAQLEAQEAQRLAPILLDALRAHAATIAHNPAQTAHAFLREKLLERFPPQEPATRASRPASAAPRVAPHAVTPALAVSRAPAVTETRGKEGQGPQGEGAPTESGRRMRKPSEASARLHHRLPLTEEESLHGEQAIQAWDEGRARYKPPKSISRLRWTFVLDTLRAQKRAKGEFARGKKPTERKPNPAPPAQPPTTQTP